MASYVNITNTGSSLTVNSVVYIQNEEAILITPSITTDYPIGVLLENVGTDESTYVPVSGEINFDTRSFNPGDIVYCSTASTVTNILPNTPYVIELGIVLTSNVLGKILLNPTVKDGTVSTVINDNFQFVHTVDDLPTSILGVKYLDNEKTYFVTDEIDLLGDRLVAGTNTTILGASSENCRIKSTGLIGTALLTSNYSLPIRNITFEADVALNLSGDSVTTALDWFGVNFTNCNTIGTISNYSNFIASDSAFLGAGNLTFGGTIGTIGFNQCLFDTLSGQTAITIPSTTNITRRFRVTYSSFITLTGETSLNVSTGATIPIEGYILDTVNFGGSGTFIEGVQYTDNKALFINCRGINNSSELSYYTMNSNITPTVVGSSGVAYKISGDTTSQTITQKFTNTNNRATYTGALKRAFKVTASLSCISGNNNQIGIYISKNGTIASETETYMTTSGTGRAENGKVQGIFELNTNDYIEIFVENSSAVQNITVTDLSVIVEALN